MDMDFRLGEDLTLAVDKPDTYLDESDLRAKYSVLERTNEHLSTALLNAQTRARKRGELVVEYESCVRAGVHRSLKELSEAREGVKGCRRSALGSGMKSVDSSPPAMEKSELRNLQLQESLARVKFEAVADFAAPLILLSVRGEPSSEPSKLNGGSRDSGSETDWKPAPVFASLLGSSDNTATSSLQELVEDMRSRLHGSVRSSVLQSALGNKSFRRSHSMPGTPLHSSVAPIRMGVLDQLSLAAPHGDGQQQKEQEFLSSYFDDLRSSLRIESPVREECDKPSDSKQDLVDSDTSDDDSDTQTTGPRMSLKDSQSWHRVLSYAQVLEGCLLLENALDLSQKKVLEMDSRLAETRRELEQLRKAQNSELLEEVGALRSEGSRMREGIASLIRERDATRNLNSQIQRRLDEAEGRILQYQRLLFHTDSRQFFSKDTLIYFIHVVFGASLIFSNWWKRFIHWLFRRQRHRITRIRVR